MKLLTLFWTFFKIGLFTIGGGYAMIPMIQSEAISKGWLTDEEMLNFLAVSESTPGPFAINIATFIGQEQAGILGAILAVIGVILPSIIIIIIVYKFYTKFIVNKNVQGTLAGIKGIVIGLIFAVGINLIGKEVYSYTDTLTLNYSSIGITVILATLFIIFRKKMNPILFIGIGALLGILAYGVLPLIF